MAVQGEIRGEISSPYNNDALYSEDIDDEESYSNDENLDLPTIHWINSTDGYKHYCEVLERIEVNSETAESETTVAKTERDY